MTASFKFESPRFLQFSCGMPIKLHLGPSDKLTETFQNDIVKSEPNDFSF